MGFLDGGGELGRLIRSRDWSESPLGPIEAWPDCLKYTVGMMLPAQAQIVLFWGPAFLALYNDAYAPTIGDKHPSALGRPACENWSELWSDLEPLLQSVLQTGETVVAKDRPFYIERHGYPEDVYFDISYSPVRDEGGDVRGVLCIVNETTERVASQRALARSQERLSYALSASGMVGTFDWHIPSDIIYSDAQFAAMFSVDPKNGEKGAPLSAYMAGIHPVDREQIGEAVNRAIATGEKYVQEYRLVRTDGSVRWIEARGECLYDKDGKPLRFPGAAIDITARKKAEEIERRLAAIISSAYDAIMSIDLDMTITSWNRGAEHLYGYSEEEAIGKPVSILLPPDRPDEEPAIIARIRRGERVEPHETKRRRKDGRLIEVLLTVSPIRDEYGRIVGASKIAQDISIRKDAERVQHVLAEEMRHRVKNILATVQAIARQTFRSHGEAGSDVQNALLARLLSLSKAHDLLMHENWDGAELSDIVTDVLAPYEGAKCTVAGPQVWLPPKMVTALSLALHELATNATKYGALSQPGGSVLITWRVMPGKVTRLELRWQERGGPAVSEPTVKGFGSHLIENAAAAQMDGEINIFYDPAGVVCEIEAPLSAGAKVTFEQAAG